MYKPGMDKRASSKKILTFQDLFNLEDIQQIQDDFAKATGVASLITAVDGTPITKPSCFTKLCDQIIRKTAIGCANCKKSDIVIGRLRADGPTFQPCLSAGLWDAGAGISIEGQHIASWLIGQVRDPKQTKENAIAYAKTIGANVEEFLDAYYKIPAMSEKQFRQVAQALFSITQQISKAAYLNYQQKEHIKQRKQVEKKLTESEAKLKSYLENTPGGIFITDQQGNFVDVNGKIAGLTGYTKEELLKLNIKDVIYPEDKHLAEQHIKRLHQTGKSSGEFRCLNKDGSIRFYSINSLTISENKFLEFVNDISERKETEQELQKTMALQSAMISNIGDVIVIIDDRGINRYKSSNVKKFFGWEPNELIGKKTWENIHPEDINKTKKFFSELISKKNGVGKTECRYRCKSGEYRWIEFTGTNLLSDSNIDGILGNYHDIEERKQIIESLKESEQRYKSLHEASFGGIVLHDKGMIINCNQGLSDISGFTYNELIGMDGLSLIAKQSRETVMNNIQSGYEKPYEVFGVKKRGEVYPLRLEARNIPLKGKTIRAVEFRDISDQVREREQRQELQLKLMQSQKMEAIGRLAGGIAHDFNNILSGIIGYSELSLAKLDDPDLLEKNLRSILSASSRAKDLIARILTFSRQDSSDTPPLMVGPIVREVIDLMRATLPSTIKIKSNSFEEKFPIKANATSLHEALINLCVNAAHAMNNTGELEIFYEEITLKEKKESRFGEIIPGAYKVIKVVDTGCGIQDKNLSKIFEPYFTTKDVGEGTGLGLSVVFGIVNKYNGKMIIDSKIGKGTSFSILIPKAHVEMAEKKDIPQQEAQKGTERILLVDDEPDICELMEMLLEDLGYKVTTFVDSEKAYEFLKGQHHNFDLIITDQTMPKLTGIDLAKKTVSINKSTPIILCSGYSKFLDEGYKIPENIKAICIKPMRIAELTSHIRKIFDNY